MNNIYTALQIMGLGMAGIFFVLILIYIMIKVLLRVFPAKENN